MKNFKKVISVVMALAMIISSFTAVSAAKFADVADTAAYTEAVEVLAALGVVNGVPQEDGTFNFEPEKSVTRAEAATMIVGALNLADDAKAATGTSRFADVNSQAAWAAGYVNVGVAQGFINGYDANTFGPLDNVTYAQMCVMLTQIIGYGDYAKAYGGWPTGYTTMAANAGINAGLAVATDADLTKGQVAIMIWNALQAPLLGVSEYAIDGNVYKPQNGKNGAEYKTLFTEKFDGFTARITISGTPLTNNEDENEVDFTIEKSDWWLPAEHPVPYSTATYTFVPNLTNIEFVEGVDVINNHLQTGKAVFVLNEDEEASLIYFKATERSASKEFAADTYYMQKNLVDSKQYAWDSATNTGYAKIRFGSSFYTFDPTIEIFVNGVSYDTISATADLASTATTNPLTAAQTALDNILGSAQGTVKVLKVGATATGYNKIFVNLYQVAEVIGVDEGNDETTISLASVSNALNTSTANLDEIVISKEAVEEGKTTVTVTKNGEEATLSSLAIGDIVAYSTVFGSAAIPATDIEDPKTIDIIATNDKISGRITSVADQGTTSDLYDDEYTIGGEVYTITPGRTGLGLGINNSVDVTLDPFGRIFKTKTNAESTNYAIALKKTQDDDGIRLLLADGTVKTYEVDTEKATNFTADFVTSNINNVIGVSGRIVEYTVSGKNGKINMINKLNTGMTTADYKSRTGLLGGGNKIVDSTPIIRLADTSSTTPATFYAEAANYTVITKGDLVDTVDYDAYVEKINTTTVGFVVITRAGSEFGETSRPAVAIADPAVVLTEDGDKVKSVKVLYNGEVQDLLFAMTGTSTSVADNLNIGDVFFFETDSDGFVKTIFVDGAVSAAPTFTNYGTTDVWTSKITVADWAYGLEEPTTQADIQFVHGVVVEVTSDAISFANYAEVNSGALDTTLDLDQTMTLASTDPNYAKGIVTYGFASDCVAYTKDMKMQTREESERFDVTSPASIRASRLASFDVHDTYNTSNEPVGLQEDGKFGDDLRPTFETPAKAAIKMIDSATTAVAMIVDGQIVAIYAVER